MICCWHRLGDEAKPYRSKGPTGIAVRTLLALGPFGSQEKRALTKLNCIQLGHHLSSSVNQLFVTATNLPAFRDFIVFRFGIELVEELSKPKERRDTS